MALMYFNTSECGVYCIYNTVNGKRYIGSTTISFTVRWCGHRQVLRKGTCHNKRFQRAWNKYGESSFEFSILATCAQEHAVEMEQYFIDFFDSCDQTKGYNLSPTAGTTRGFKMPRASVEIMASKIRGQKRTPEQRERMSEAQKLASSKKKPMSEKHRQSVRDANKRRAGRKLPEWHKERIRAYGRARITSAESRAKMSATRRNPKFMADMKARRDAKTGRMLPLQWHTWGKEEKVSGSAWR